MENNEYKVQAKIGLSKADKEIMANDIYEQVNKKVEPQLNDMHETIQSLGGLQPSGVDSASNILSYTENKGVYVANDTGGWYYWNGSSYVYGGSFQSDINAVDLGEIIPESTIEETMKKIHIKIEEYTGIQNSDNSQKVYMILLADTNGSYGTCFIIRDIWAGDCYITYFQQENIKKYHTGYTTDDDRLSCEEMFLSNIADKSVTEEKLNVSVKAQYKNLQNANENVTFTYEHNNEIMYAKSTPTNSLPYAKINKLGGRSIKSEFVNLLDLTDVKETTQNGVTYSVKNGVISLNGEITLGFGKDFLLKNNLTLNAGTYTCVDVSDVGNLLGINVYVNFTDGTSYNFGNYNTFKTFTLTESKTIKNIGFWISESESSYSREVKLMLVSGETLPTKFALGKFLDFKINKIVTTGLNLISLKDVKETTQNGVTYSVKDGVITLNGNCKSWIGINFYLNDKLILNSQTYTLCELNRYSTECGLYVDAESGNIFSITNLLNYDYKETKTFFGKNVVTNIALGVAAGKYNNVKFKPMLVMGENVPTQFEAYKENIYSIPEEVLSLNGYGQSNPEDESEYNYIDFENKEFIAIGNITNNEWVTFDTPIKTDISRYINCYLEVTGGGNIVFKNAAQAEVYSDITFSVKKDILTKSDEIYKKTNLPILYLTGSTLGISKENKVNLSYVYGDLSGTCTLKWQGSSSLSYPKKNYTIKFDNPFEAKTGWGSQSKYCLKANYIDYTHSRNVVSARLWGQVVKSRTNVPTELSSLVNGGAIDGFPICVVINGEYQGLYTFNIPKDAWLFGMGTLTTEAIVGAGAMSDITGFKAPPEFGDDKFEIEYAPNEDDTRAIETSITNLYNALQNATANNFDSTVGKFIDIESAIDYCLFVVLLNHFDGANRNYLMATFDNVKWYMSAYDMDCTYGLNWNGSKILQPLDYQINFDSYISKNKLMECICNFKKDELKARYAVLRNSILEKNNIALQFYDFIGEIPKSLYDEEVKIWTNLPSTSINNANQIVHYFTERCEYVDLWVDWL